MSPLSASTKVEWVYVPSGDVLYRYLDTAEHAQAFVKGKIFISTLQRCRLAEDGLRRDEQEGSVIYAPGNVDGNVDDPHVNAVAKRLGIGLPPGPGGRIVLNNCTAHDILDD